MPRYGEKALIPPADALSPFRWTLDAPTGSIFNRAAGRAGLLFGSRSFQDAPAEWLTEANPDPAALFGIQDLRGGDAEAELMAAKTPMTMRWLQGGEYHDFKWTGVTDRHRVTPGTALAPYITLDGLTGRTIESSSGAAAMDAEGWEGALVTLRSDTEAAPTAFWVEAVDEGGVVLDVAEASELAQARETAVVECRWRPQTLAGHEIIWRGKTWTVIEVETTDRRRTQRLSLARLT